VERAAGLADDEIELKVLHGRIEDFLDRRGEPMDLVDEQYVAVFEIGEECGKVSGLGDHRLTSRGNSPSSRATIWASVVLPKPGGPANSTWSSASRRPRAASMNTFRLNRLSAGR
jgi:hypothetical protein